MATETTAEQAGKHTPGPWRSSWYEENSRTHIGSWGLTAGSDSRRVVFRRCKQGDATALANARLIAAAPDLLAACKAALPRLNARRFDTAAHDDIVTQLEAAIAKAESR